MATYTCRKCNEQNPEGATHCVRCGEPLAIITVEGTGPSQGWLGRIFSFLGGKGRQRDKHAKNPQRLMAPQPGTTRLNSASPSEMLPSASGVSPVAAAPHAMEATSTQTTLPPTPPARPSYNGTSSLHPYNQGDIFGGRYQITTTQVMSFSVFYDAIDLFCARPECQGKPLTAVRDGMCAYCRAPLDTVLIHERQTPAGFAPELIRRLLPLGRAGHPRILNHRSMLRYEHVVYTIVDHPGQWHPLVQARRPYASDDAVAVVAQMGRALTYLHQQGVAYTGNGNAVSREGLESWVILNGGDVKLADLSRCSPLAQQDAGRAQIGYDIAFLGQCLVFLTHDPQQPDAGELAHVPSELRLCIERANMGQYASVLEMLNDLTVISESPAAGRRLKPSEGHATHQGRMHTRNEDMIVTFSFDKKQQGKSVPIGFYMVADGMGGHDAGDVASRTVYEVVTNWIVETNILPDLRKTTRKLTMENVPGKLLEQAIQSANEALDQHAQRHGSNLGSTVTAALVIGDVATIANVGDSRTYLLRQDHLRQITHDHSLVARLVEANVITPEEVRKHPQRNQIFRNLGQKATVQVDIFTVHLQPDDRLILCCDGLWEMVLDAEIQRIVEEARTPQKACDALIAAANQAGGEDNISVIVVEME